VHLHKGAVQRDSLDPHADDPRFLKGRENPYQYPLAGPTAQTGVHGVPGPEMLGQTAPFAAILGYIQHGVEHLEVG